MKTSNAGQFRVNFRAFSSEVNEEPTKKKKTIIKPQKKERQKYKLKNIFQYIIFKWYLICK